MTASNLGENRKISLTKCELQGKCAWTRCLSSNPVFPRLSKALQGAATLSKEALSSVWIQWETGKVFQNPSLRKTQVKIVRGRQDTRKEVSHTLALFLLFYKHLLLTTAGNKVTGLGSPCFSPGWPFLPSNDTHTSQDDNQFIKLHDLSQIICSTDISLNFPTSLSSKVCQPHKACSPCPVEGELGKLKELKNHWRHRLSSKTFQYQLIN